MKRTATVTTTSKKARTEAPPPPQPAAQTFKTWREFDAATGGRVVRAYKAMVKARAEVQAACAKEAETPDSKALVEAARAYHEAVLDLEDELHAAPPVKVLRLLTRKAQWYFSLEEAAECMGEDCDVEMLVTEGYVKHEEEEIATLTVAQAMQLLRKVN